MAAEWNRLIGQFALGVIDRRQLMKGLALIAGGALVADVAEPIMERFATGEYPHLVEMATEYYFQPGYDFGDEFDFGLTLVLDGLARSLP